MVDPDNSERLIPVIIEAGDFKGVDSIEDVWSLEIKILEANK
jgi:hypothetical protein